MKASFLLNSWVADLLLHVPTAASYGEIGIFQSLNRALVAVVRSLSTFAFVQLAIQPRSKVFRLRDNPTVLYLYRLANGTCGTFFRVVYTKYFGATAVPSK
jgi:hypothetical protein